MGEVALYRDRGYWRAHAMSQLAEIVSKSFRQRQVEKYVGELTSANDFTNTLCEIRPLPGAGFCPISTSFVSFRSMLCLGANIQR